MRFVLLFVSFAPVTAAALISCSSSDNTQRPGPGDDAGISADASSPTPDASSTDGGGHDSSATTDDAGTGAEGDDAGGADAGGTGTDGATVDSGNTVTLTILNYRNYCNLTIDDGGASNDSPITAGVTPGTVVTLVASPSDPMFSMVADPWFGVDQNDGGAAPGTIAGSGADETSTATVTVNANHCVSLCCEFPGEDTCPTTSQCP